MKIILKQIVVLIITFQAKMVLKKYNPKIVAVTGSVGKTSAKDAIYNAISTQHFVRKSKKSFNSEVGLPLTILNCPNGWSNPFLWLRNIVEGILLILLPNHYPEWLVLEIGADRPGDISKMASWLNTDVVVITQFSKVPAHVEFFSSPEEVMKEKASLIKSLKDDGTLVLNADDEDVFKLSKTILPTQKIVSFGKAPQATVRVSHTALTYDGGNVSGVSFRIDYGGSSLPVSVQDAIGDQHVYPVLAGVAVGVSQGGNVVDIAAHFDDYLSPPGRMRLVRGVKNSTIIDDTYNSSPVALEKALDALESVETSGRKIAVLGDMLELGSYTADAHKDLGRKVASIVDTLYTVGVRARGFAEGALLADMDEKNILQYDESARAGKELELSLKEGDVVLIKGSQGVRMERVVLEVMANPERAHRILVRQEREWQDR